MSPMTTASLPLASRTRKPTVKPQPSAEWLASQVRQIADDAWKVQSRTHAGLSHTVRRTDFGGIACNCQAGGRGNRCWHIQAVNAYHSAQLAQMDARFDEMFPEEETMTRAEQMAEKCAVPVIDPADDGDLWMNEPPTPVQFAPHSFIGSDDFDPFARADEVILTPAEVETLLPVPLKAPVMRWVAPVGFYADLSAFCDDMRI